MLIVRHLAGQAVVRAINLLAGMIILWQLPVEEYALYTVASLLLVVVTLGSDLGISQAANTIGVRLYGDRGKMGALFSSAYYYQQVLLLVSAVIALMVSMFVLFVQTWEITQITICLMLVLLAGWIQLPLNLRRTILNIHHDSDALFRAGAAEAVTRLLLVFACFVFPSANLALGINLVGTLAARVMLTKECEQLMAESMPRDAARCSEIKTFIIPLIPIMIYYAVQNQISILMLALLGNTASIADVGALSRLGLIISVLHLFFPFFLQPYFARIDDRSEFIRNIVRLLVVILFFSFFMLMSAYELPGAWLFILGGNYSELTRELPIVMLTTLLTLTGGAIYTVVIAKMRTEGQTWSMVVGIASQVAYIFFVGVDSSYNALVLNMLPTVGYACIQIIILARILYSWKQ